MNYNPVIYTFMIKRMKTGLKPYYSKEEIHLWTDCAKPIYKTLLKQVQGISDDNPMASNITTSFVVIAIWLASGRKITVENMSAAMKTAVDIKPLRMIFGSINMNKKSGIRMFSRMMHANAKWAEKHPEDYNTWDFHFNEHLHKDGFYYHFNHCPIADFCQEHGYEEINPVLCNIDFTTMSMMHSVLYRKHTIANGDGICDYWCVGNHIQYPQ